MPYRFVFNLDTNRTRKYTVNVKKICTWISRLNHAAAILNDNYLFILDIKKCSCLFLQKVSQREKGWVTTHCIML